VPQRADRWAEFWRSQLWRSGRGHSSERALIRGFKNRLIDGQRVADGGEGSADAAVTFGAKGRQRHRAVNTGSDLTANRIVQEALVIGGTKSSPGLVTIDASDVSGNPLIGSPASLLGE
jgi:hypothetical protein